MSREGGSPLPPGNFPFHYGIITMLAPSAPVVVNFMERVTDPTRCRMWKEIGKALMVSVVIPVGVQLTAQVAEQYREKLAKKTKFTIKLT